jgi:hypothetical protein
VSPTDTLAELPLSTLFSAPLIAAIDASAQAQQETVDLLREVGFERDGTLSTVSFEYATTEVDSTTGEASERRKTLSVPVLLFLSLPELVVHEVEQTFSAKIVDVESSDGERPVSEGKSDRRVTKGEATRSSSLAPRRLTVAPATQSESFARRSRSAFDLDITMRAEVENKSTGVDLLERTLATTVTDGDATDEQMSESERKASRPDRGKEETE